MTGSSLLGSMDRIAMEVVPTAGDKTIMDKNISKLAREY